MTAYPREVCLLLAAKELSSTQPVVCAATMRFHCVILWECGQGKYYHEKSSAGPRVQREE